MVNTRATARPAGTPVRAGTPEFAALLDPSAALMDPSAARPEASHDARAASTTDVTLATQLPR